MTLEADPVVPAGDDFENAAWTWLEDKFLNIEAGDDPNDRDYGADDMVDAFIAGRRLAHATLTAEDEALRDATDLAVNLWRKHYQSTAPDWRPLSDLRGVISQIDNMTTALSRTPATAGDIDTAGLSGGYTAAVGGLNAWLAEHFTGQGVAIRRKEEPPIPGEPFMSMEVAKRLTREAVECFLAYQSSSPDMSK